MRWIFWILAVLFYLYEYVLRVSPSVMAPELLGTFHITAATFGSMSAFYLYLYAPMQIPAGLLMDRFGARRLLTLAALLCAVGALLFSKSTSLLPAELARSLMGAGSAFAFVGMVYICSHWFEGKRLALLIGLGNSLGMLGAVFGEGPLSKLITLTSWRTSMLILSASGFLLSLIIFICIKQTRETNHRKKLNFPKLAKSFKSVIHNKKTWINALLALSFYATTVAFAGLWGVPFLQKKFMLTKADAGFASSMIFVGWIIGGPIFGHLSDTRKKRKPFLLIASLGALLATSALIYLPSIPLTLVFALLLLIGIFLSAQLLTYTLAVEYNLCSAKGFAISITNFAVFVAGAILQPLVGMLLDYKWDGTVLHGIPSYSLANYQFAMGVFPLSLLIAFVIAFFLPPRNNPNDEPGCKNG